MTETKSKFVAKEGTGFLFNNQLHPNFVNAGGCAKGYIMLNGVKLQIALWKGKKGGFRLSLDTNDEMGMTTEILIGKMLEGIKPKVEEPAESPAETPEVKEEVEELGI
tara:strand:+ start:419 stop:742 length:324 start_codon:yes stop_codon:yes gene_type:complete